jgi:hypothetical protein
LFRQPRKDILVDADVYSYSKYWQIFPLEGGGRRGRGDDRSNPMPVSFGEKNIKSVIRKRKSVTKLKEYEWKI